MYEWVVVRSYVQHHVCQWDYDDAHHALTAISSASTKAKCTQPMLKPKLLHYKNEGCSDVSVISAYTNLHVFWAIDPSCNVLNIGNCIRDCHYSSTIVAMTLILVFSSHVYQI